MAGAKSRLLANGWLLPCALWIGFIGLVLGTAGSLAALTHTHWDGDIYVSIAAHGYRIGRCGDPPQWCGNPWFPGWPWVNEAIATGLGLRALGIPYERTFVGTAAVALLILLVLLYRHSVAFMNSPERWTGEEREIGFWACAGVLSQPGAFYFLTHFPYAFAYLTIVLFRIATATPTRLRCSTRSGSTLGAFAAFSSALSYPAMFLFAIYPFARFLSTRGYREVRRWIELAAWMALFFAGTLCVCLVFYFKFGLFWLYFMNQAQYARAAPLVNTLSLVVDVLRTGNESERLTFLWYAFGLTLVGLRLPNAHREPSLWMTVLVLVFYPATGARIGSYRYDLLAFPMLVLLGAARCSSWLKLAYLVSGLALQMQILYPDYLADRLM